MKRLGFGSLSPEEIGKLTSDEKAAVASEYLKGVEPGFLPLPLFSELSRLMTISTVEIVLMQPEDEPRIILAKRPPSDPWWPNQLHVPGSVVLPTDPVKNQNDFSGTINRILEDELAGAVELSSKLNFLEPQRRVGPRGHEVTTVHWAEASVSEELLPNTAGLFLLNDLHSCQPEALVDGTIQTITQAISAFETSR